LEVSLRLLFWLENHPIPSPGRLLGKMPP